MKGGYIVDNEGSIKIFNILDFFTNHIDDNNIGKRDFQIEEKNEIELLYSMKNNHLSIKNLTTLKEYIMNIYYY